jgi:Tfp pilus assembly protein PilN
VRAVNLIPAESGRGGAGAFVLVGALGVLLAGVLFYVLTGNTVVDRKAELTQLQTQVAAAQSQAEAMRPYRDFASLAQSRVETVRSLGKARFDWHRALGDLSKVIPDNVWLTSLLGTVTSGVNVDGASAGTTSTLRSALPNPAIEMTGCTTDHDSVVRLISDLRLIDGVQRVALAQSAKATLSSGSGTSGGGDSGDCRHGHANFPEFDLVIFFKPLPALPSTGAATAGGAVPAATTAPAGTTTPAPTGTSPAGGSAQ